MEIRRRKRRFPISDLAGHCYALVSHQPYYFWDVPTTADLGIPEMFAVRECETEVVPAGPCQVRTLLRSGGWRVTAPATVDTARFYDYMLAQWAR